MYRNISPAYPLLLAALLALAPTCAGATPPSPDRLKAAENEARQRARELYQKFLPKPEDLGPGWSLALRLPRGFGFEREVSEDEYWRESDLLHGLTFSQLTRAELDALLDQLEAETQAQVEQMSPQSRALLAEVAAGIPPEQYVWAVLFNTIRLPTSASLPEQLELLFAAPAADLVTSSGEIRWNDGQKRYFSQLLQIFARPVVGRSLPALKNAIRDQVHSVKNLTAMKYEKPYDWSGKRFKMEVVIRLLVLDREHVEDKAHDLRPDQKSALEHRLTQSLRKLTAFELEGVRHRKKTSVDDLRAELEATSDPERRSEIAEKMRQEEEALSKTADLAGKASVSVSMRDFGDNCYVIETKGRSVTLPMGIAIVDMPAVRLDAYLRNGNAVVFIGVTGAFARDILTQHLDELLSEMDARTALFRK